MIVYTLKQKKDTGELHLFEATPTLNNECTPNKISICKKMDKSESVANVFACQTEEEARQICASRGREVCGTCVSSLYATF
jgi:hypothetical protein